MPVEATLSARVAAYEVLMEIEHHQAYAQLALKKILDSHRVKPIDARLTVQIVNGTVRMRYALDHIISSFLKQPLKELKPEILIILRLSLFQLHYLDRIEAYAAVDEGVTLAKRYGNLALSRLVNAVLRNYLRKVEEHGKAALLPGKQIAHRYLHVTLSYPSWLVSYLLEHYGWQQAEQFCLWGNSHPGLLIRANTLKITPAQLLAQLAELEIDAEAIGFAPETIKINHGSGSLLKSSLFAEGYFAVQGQSSQLVAHALAPQPGQRVLDLCAAPGGKTCHLAALMQDVGELHAFDVHPHKIGLIRENAKRLGLSCIQARDADSTQLGPDYQAWADCVLLDAPCSGLGVLNQRPDLRYKHSAASVAELAKLSQQLLSAAAGYVKPGGKICFSTCTITEEENSQVVQAFLAAHPQFRLIPLLHLQPYLPETAAADLAAGCLQLLPQTHHSEGFFIALLEKAKA